MAKLVSDLLVEQLVEWGVEVEALLRGEKDGMKIIKTVLQDKVREVT
jgi:hypothetical protein